MQDLRSEYHTLFGYFLDDFWSRFEAVDPASYCGRLMLLAPISAPISPAGPSRTDMLRIPASYRGSVLIGSCGCSDPHGTF
ncbi:hypothetical protein SLEP1_g6956 [Rubroshorea leprosula]|uniref:Uncharacterized protein n=1 Tax=Rubroshorea leprosula TaxID=152421 RepID=A0AAV5I7S2_9ROSI|nr:hypothetical protein SLEP1_g6956 [Rubroshorea leprosula]